MELLLTLLGFALPLLAIFSILFLVFGPLSVVHNRKLAGDKQAPSRGEVFGYTLVTLPTIIGWPVILYYALTYKKGEVSE